VLRDRLGVVPAARGERLAVGPKHGRHLGIGDADWARPLVNDAAAQPTALVGDGEKARAIRRDADCRDAAEMLVRRGQLDAAAIDQVAEARAGRISGLKRRDRLRAHLDADRRFGLARAGLPEGGESEEGEESEDNRNGVIPGLTPALTR